MNGGVGGATATRSGGVGLLERVAEEWTYFCQERRSRSTAVLNGEVGLLQQGVEERGLL